MKIEQALVMDFIGDPNLTLSELLLTTPGDAFPQHPRNQALLNYRLGKIDDTQLAKELDHSPSPRVVRAHDNLVKLRDWIDPNNQSNVFGEIHPLVIPAHVAKFASDKIALTGAKIQNTADKVRSFFGKRDKKLEGILQAHQLRKMQTKFSDSTSVPSALTQLAQEQRAKATHARNLEFVSAGAASIPILATLVEFVTHSEFIEAIKGTMTGNFIGAIGIIGLLMTFVQEYRRSQNSDNAQSFTNWADYFKTVEK